MWKPREWNDLHNSIERNSFRSQEDLDEENFHLGELAEEYAWEKVEAFASSQGFDADILRSSAKWRPERLPEEFQKIFYEAEEEYFADIKKEQSKDGVRLQVIEELLSELGARMMRPYEHWNDGKKLAEICDDRRSTYTDEEVCYVLHAVPELIKFFDGTRHYMVSTHLIVFIWERFHSMAQARGMDMDQFPNFNF